MKDILQEALKIVRNVQYGDPVYTDEQCDDTSVLLEKGLFLHRSGDYTDAIEYYDKLLSINPEDTVVMTRKGLALFSQGKKEEAIKWYDRVLEIDSEDERALKCKIWALASLYEEGFFSRKTIPEEVICCCNKFLTIRPDDFMIQYMKIRFLSRTGKYEEVILSCDEILSVNAGDIPFIIIKINHLEQLGREEEAKLCRQSLIEAVQGREKTCSNKSYYSLNDIVDYIDKRLIDDEEKYKDYEISMETDEEGNKIDTGERKKKLADYRRLYGITWEKAKKIDYITYSCGVSHEEAKKVLEKYNYHTDRAFVYIKKHGDISREIEYVMRRTKVSDEGEVRKALEKNNYDEIYTVMRIKIEQRRERKKENMDRICQLYGVSEEKAEKIIYITSSCKVAPDEAIKALEKNDYDKKKTFIDIKKHSDLSEDIEYIIKETEVSEEEAKKALEENGYNSTGAVMSIEDKKDTVKAAEKILQKKKQL